MYDPSPSFVFQMAPLCATRLWYQPSCAFSLLLPAPPLLRPGHTSRKRYNGPTHTFLVSVYSLCLSRCSSCPRGLCASVCVRVCLCAHTSCGCVASSLTWCAYVFVCLSAYVCVVCMRAGAPGDWRSLLCAPPMPHVRSHEATMWRRALHTRPILADLVVQFSATIWRAHPRARVAKSSFPLLRMS